MVGNKGSKKVNQIAKSVGKTPPRSLVLARKGLKTSSDLCGIAVAAMCDVLESKITPAVSNALATQEARLLKTKEMEFRYGQLNKQSGQKHFLLTEGAAA